MSSARTLCIRAGRMLVSAVSGVVLVLTLAGCSGGPSPEPSPSTAPTPSATATAVAPAEPALLPEGTAEDNLAYFDLVNERFLAAGQLPGGRPIIDNLVAAGFDKSMMQVTPDSTSIGLDVDSVQFAVRFGEQCLIGQTSAAGYVGIVGPAVSATNCLLGTTRAIDW